MRKRSLTTLLSEHMFSRHSTLCPQCTTLRQLERAATDFLDTSDLYDDIGIDKRFHFLIDLDVEMRQISCYLCLCSDAEIPKEMHICKIHKYTIGMQCASSQI